MWLGRQIGPSVDLGIPSLSAATWIGSGGSAAVFSAKAADQADVAAAGIEQTAMANPARALLAPRDR